MSLVNNSSKNMASPLAGSNRRGAGGRGRQGNNTSSPRPTKRRSGKPTRKPTDPCATQALEVEKLMRGDGVSGSSTRNSRETGANSSQEENTGLSSRINAYLTTHSGLPSEASNASKAIPIVTRDHAPNLVHPHSSSTLEIKSNSNKVEDGDEKIITAQGVMTKREWRELEKRREKRQKKKQRLINSSADHS